MRHPFSTIVTRAGGRTVLCQAGPDKPVCGVIAAGLDARTARHVAALHDSKYECHKRDLTRPAKSVIVRSEQTSGDF